MELTTVWFKQVLSHFIQTMNHSLSVQTGNGFPNIQMVPGEVLLLCFIVWICNHELCMDEVFAYCVRNRGVYFVRQISCHRSPATWQKETHKVLECLCCTPGKTADLFVSPSVFILHGCILDLIERRKLMLMFIHRFLNMSASELRSTCALNAMWSNYDYYQDKVTNAWNFMHFDKLPSYVRT